MQEIPNEQAVLSAMRSSLGEASGLYLFPGMGLGPDATTQQKQAAAPQYALRLAANPSGILVYHPPGAQALTPRRLVTEFLTELVESVLVVILLAQTRLTGFASRLGFVVLAGVMGAVVTNISYWNWYGFPVTYTASYMTIEIVGFICIGLVAAAVMRNPNPAKEQNG